jgi:hypothetical protein
VEYGRNIANFSLAPLAVPYEKWNGKTDLLYDGKKTSYNIRGCDLKAQFQSGKYYVLVTENDCVFEEAVNITLLAENFKPLASSTVPRIWYPIIAAPSYFFEKLIWQDTNHFDLYIQNEPLFYRYSIRDFSIPMIHPRLRKRLAVRDT